MDSTDSMVALKSRLRATWMDGNYDVFSRPMEAGTALFADRIPDLVPGARLLDVACGSGQLAVIAARRGVAATGVDIAANSIAAARARAAAEGLTARFDEGDAEALPYADASFDVVGSVFGAMFAPQPGLVAAEFTRVCRPGGVIAMANWTREGFIGRMFAVIARFIAPAGMPSPLLWGDEAHIASRFGAGVAGLQVTRRMFPFDYAMTPAGVVDFFRRHYGPTTRAFATLDAEAGAALEHELVTLWTSANESADPARTRVHAEYAEVIARRV